MTGLAIADEGPVTRITLDRAGKRNALSLALMQDLLDALASARGRVVVITANGPAFSAGHDLRELLDASPEEHDEVFATCSALMQRVQAVPQPVIAEVRGVATAAGCQLVASCDLAVAERGARFATPGVNIGLFCSTPAVPLVRAIGPKRAMQMLLTGDLVDAETACAWGLVNEVVDEADLTARVDELANHIARASREVLALGKRTFYEQIALDSSAAYDVTAAVMAGNASLPDAKEGISAFLEKRPPAWPSDAGG